MSALVTIIVVLVVIGVVLWLINTYVPMASPIKTILNIIIVLAVIIWILSLLGLFDIGSLKVK